MKNKERKKETNKLTKKVTNSATEMMNGDRNAAEAWLNTPLEILGNETPLAHAATEKGAQEVEAIIGRIVHGVFS